MTSATKQQAQTNQQIQAQLPSIRKGLCTSIDWPNGVAIVDLPGSELPLPMVGVAPIINERCWVQVIGATAVVLGPVPRPPYSSVVSAPAAGLVDVKGDDNITRTVTYDGGTLDLGTRVLVDWTSGGQIIGIPLADPNTGLPIVKPHGNIPTNGGLQTRIFYAASSATWRDGEYASGWVGGDVWDSDHNRGAWFYQGIADTIPDNAVDGHLYIAIPGGNGYGGNPSIGAHALTGPNGNLSITGRKVIPSSGGTAIDISEFFDAFKTGALRGIGTGGGGNWRFPPAGQSNSGTITATWRNP